MKNEILILGSFNFPDKDAAAKRVYGFGLYLKDKSFSVKYLSWGNKGRKEDFVTDNLYCYNGFEYIPIGEFKKNKNIFKRIYNYLLMGSFTLKYLKSIDISNINSIIAYNAPSLFLLRLNTFCKKNNIDLILDCTEWYEYSHLSGGRFGPLSLDTSIRMNFINKYIGKMIVVSSYLFDFYKDKVNTLIKIPFFIDMDINLKYSLNSKNFNKPIKLVYIGSPGKKDKFETVFHVLNKINQDKLLFTLDIYGITKDDYLKIDIKFNSKYLDNEYITFKGKVEQEIINSIYINYHFSIVFRPNERYAKAGFPTKLVESFSNGIPVIASNVGDLSVFVKDEISGYIIDSLDELELENVFKKILSLTKENYLKMSNNAYDIALDNFYYKNNKNFEKFLRNK